MAYQKGEEAKKKEEVDRLRRREAVLAQELRETRAELEGLIGKRR